MVAVGRGPLPPLARSDPPARAPLAHRLLPPRPALRSDPPLRPPPARLCRGVRPRLYHQALQRGWAAGAQRRRSPRTLGCRPSQRPRIAPSPAHPTHPPPQLARRPGVQALWAGNCGGGNGAGARAPRRAPQYCVGGGGGCAAVCAPPAPTHPPRPATNPPPNTTTCSPTHPPAHPFTPPHTRSRTLPPSLPSPHTPPPLQMSRLSTWQFTKTSWKPSTRLTMVGRGSAPPRPPVLHPPSPPPPLLSRAPAPPARPTCQTRC